ncbi:hypothetical protein H0H92_007657 [Tricholoma furcatifolium]|nr:hypothetical protein H0H92_007657 [Tricholoma furcatifolium]
MLLHRTRQFHSSALSAAVNASTRRAVKNPYTLSQVRLDSEPCSAHVKINEKAFTGLRSPADAFALIRDIERRYGAVREYNIPKDFELDTAFAPFAFVVFKDPGSLKRLTETATHSFVRPSVDHDRPGGVSLDELEPLLKPNDFEKQEPSSSLPRFDDSETSSESDSKDTISYTIQPANSNTFTKSTSKPLPLTYSASENFLRWGGFHARKPIPPQTPLRLESVFSESDIDQFRMRAALRLHSKQLNVPNPYDAYPKQDSSAVSMEWEPLPGHESALKDTPIPSDIPVQSQEPQKPEESKPVPPAPSTPSPVSTTPPAPSVQATPQTSASNVKSVPPVVPESVTTAQAVADKMHAQAKSMTRKKLKEEQRRKQMRTNPLPDLSQKREKTTKKVQAQVQPKPTPITDLRNKSKQARQTKDAKQATEPATLKDKISGFFSDFNGVDAPQDSKWVLLGEIPSLRGLLLVWTKNGRIRRSGRDGLLRALTDNASPIPATSLYSKGRVLGHKRAKRNSRPNTSLIQIEGVATKEDAQFYLGKRVAFVYKAKREIQGSKVRVIWGRVTRPHGSSGVVKSKFRSNLPPRAFGASVRVVSDL